MKNAAISFVCLALLAACSSSSSNGSAPLGPSADGGGGGGGVDAGSYADAVNAASWAVLPNAPVAPKGAKQDDVFFTDAMHGFAVSGPDNAIYRTADGGDSWSKVKSSSGTYFRSVLFLDHDHGFVSNLGNVAGSGITDTNPLYETKDDGANWNPVTAITGTMPAGICNQTMIDATHLVAVGRVTGPSYMLTSSDAGASWTSIDMSSQLAMLIDAHFVSPTEGIVVGGNKDPSMKCTILRTTDGGQSFAPVFTSATPGSLCWKISFPSTDVGYVSVQDSSGGTGTFAKTTDGGKTWTEMPLVGRSYPAIGMGFITDDIGWVSADSSAPTYKTVDGGKTWTEDAVLKSPINRFRFVDKNTAYAIGGSVYKMTIDWNGN